jgi:hypothetical protein
VEPRKYVPTPAGGKTIALKRNIMSMALARVEARVTRASSTWMKQTVPSKFSVINMAIHKDQGAFMGKIDFINIITNYIYLHQDKKM